MTPKAQGALEYLLLIGGSVLVAVIVIILLTSLPSFVAPSDCTLDDVDNLRCWKTEVQYVCDDFEESSRITYLIDDFEEVPSDAENVECKAFGRVCDMWWNSCCEDSCKYLCSDEYCLEGYDSCCLFDKEVCVIWEYDEVETICIHKIRVETQTFQGALE